VAGTLLAFRLLEFELFIFCSRNAFMFSVKISRSVLPVYRNFVPQEKNPPPEITAALWLLGNLKVVSIELNKRVTISQIASYVKNSICSMAHLHKYRQAAPVGHLNPTVCFFYKI